MLNNDAQSYELRVLALAGRVRTGSNNRGLLRAAQDLAPQGMGITIFDLASIPPYNADLEASGPPVSVTAFKAAIRTHNALLLATPEYNRSIPGVLKNAINWASRPPTGCPLSGKPVAIMGASTGGFGTVRAQNHMHQVCQGINMLALNRTEICVARAADKFDGGGELVDGDTRQRIAQLLEALAVWTHQLCGD